ncbi:MAG: cytidine deaminase [Lachnospiraceae bacterium]|nr:cytidine deaminase [Lachnospiraceae bacterium]
MKEASIASREWLPVYDTLAASALRMRSRSYAPYSHYHVGAALMAADGTIFTGCNVENASYPVGICAERTAFSKAVSEGYREFTALVIAGAASDSAGSDFCTPCGMCRQFIREFCNGDFPIILVKTDEDGMIKEYQIHTLGELLPHSFGPEHLGM